MKFYISFVFILLFSFSVLGQEQPENSQKPEYFSTPGGKCYFINSTGKRIYVARRNCINYPPTVVDLKLTMPEKSAPPADNANQTKLAPQTINAGILNGKAISLPKPKYPKKARKARASGVVVVQVTINERGEVVSAKATSGDTLLREEAEKAALKAKFTPFLLNSQPVSVTGVIDYNFTL